MDTARWMPWRARRRPLATAARTIASWDPAVRLQSRAHLLWLTQQFTEARTTAHSAIAQPGAARTRLPDVLDLTLAPQLYAAHMPAGAQQLTDALRAAHSTAGQLAAATPRAARRTLTRLTDDLGHAQELLEHACHDVRGADLRAADPTHLYLGGLRWDSATQWPAPWDEQIRATSDPVNGGHRIRDT
ncbi:hypothetical protein ACPXCO_37415 [Streptomyces cyaneofuscatus]|uniref:hypothetical protein n=1 Tax=Streptomyces cyaneofuscatus TaxID=66883 RepID=UPI003CEE0000